MVSRAMQRASSSAPQRRRSSRPPKSALLSGLPRTRRDEHVSTRSVEARAFNAGITLPVQWDVGIKDVLSGLSEGSLGDGRSKATVGHIYLLKDFEAGRFKRHKGDFFCTSTSGSNGKRWSTTVEQAYDGASAPYQPKVTCKAHLRLAARWMRNDEST